MMVCCVVGLMGINEQQLDFFLPQYLIQICYINERAASSPVFEYELIGWLFARPNASAMLFFLLNASMASNVDDMTVLFDRIGEPRFSRNMGLKVNLLLWISEHTLQFLLKGHKVNWWNCTASVAPTLMIINLLSYSWWGMEEYKAQRIAEFGDHCRVNEVQVLSKFIHIYTLQHSKFLRRSQLPEFFSSCEWLFDCTTHNFFFLLRWVFGFLMLLLGPIFCLWKIYIDFKPAFSGFLVRYLSFLLIFTRFHFFTFAVWGWLFSLLINLLTWILI